MTQRILFVCLLFLLQPYCYRTNPTRTLVSDGDSITYGAYLPAPGTQNYGWLASHLFTTVYGYSDEAVGGSMTSTVMSRLSIDTSILVAYPGPNIFSLMIGSNDLGNNGTDPATVYANIQSICSQIVSVTGSVAGTGFYPSSPATVIVLTLLPGNFTLAGTPQQFEIARQTLNTLIRAGGACPMIVTDVGSDLSIGQPGQYTDPRFYQSDGIHPNEAGQRVIATYLRTALVSAGFGP